MTRATDSRLSFPHRFRNVVKLLVFISALLVLAVRVPSPWEEEEPPKPSPDDLLAQRYGTFLKAFIGVASYDWQTSLDMTALPEVERQWETQCGELFATPEESDTFFSHSFLLVSGQDNDRWTGGIYNLWLDQWLLLDFIWQKDLLEYRLVGFSWVAGENKSDLSKVTDSASMEGYVVNRFATAVSRGPTAAAQPQRFGIPEAAPDIQVPAQNVSRALRRHNDQMISAFAREKDQGQLSLRSAVLDLLKQAEDGTLSESFSLPNLDKAWRESLFPVHVSQKGSRALVILSSHANPYKMLMAEFDTAGPTAVLRALMVLALPTHPEEL